MTEIPTDLERKLGQTALMKWSTLSAERKAEASIDLVLGRALINLDKSEVRRQLGNPSDFNTIEPSRWCFDCTVCGEDWRYLIVDFDETNKVRDVILMLNQ